MFVDSRIPGCYFINNIAKNATGSPCAVRNAALIARINYFHEERRPIMKIQKVRKAPTGLCKCKRSC